MQLVIAEKPSVGKAIANVLGANQSNDGYVEGNGYIVSWCVGHLVQLINPDEYDEKYKKWSFDTLPIIPTNWRFSISPATAKQYKIVKELMHRSDVDELICATDAGREGECIFRYVYNFANCNKPVKRLWISSVEDKAIRDGFANLRDSSEFDNMFAAGFCRAKADWIVGMNFSRLFSCRYGSALSVGRVQTPTLAMIVQRDSDVKNFVKQQFFTVELDCGEFIASSARIDDECTAKILAEKCNGRTAAVVNVEKSIKTVNPPKLYDLTTLQREANRQYGYTAQQTLDYTQSLYESKLVTYPRTDSQFLTEDMEDTALDMVDTIYSAIPIFKPDCEFTPNVKCLINNKKVSDHHAIIPTAEIANKDINELPGGEKNILLLIAAKLITAAAPVHKYEAVKVKVICEDNEFSASGKTVLESGFKAVEKQIKAHLKDGSSEEKSEDKEKALPYVTQGQTFESAASSLAEHFTSPPKPFTEDTLLSAMETAGNSDYDENSDVEKKGLGTPATRAGIIEGLVKRQFVERSKKQIIATEKGINLISVIPDKVKSPKLTADWETRLQAIEKGANSDFAFMNDIESYVKQMIAEYGTIAENSVLNGNERQAVGKCPKCGKSVVEYPKSYSCESGKEGCGFVIWKSISGKTLPSVTAKELLTNGKTGLIKGFVNKEKKAFDAVLKLDEDGKVVFEFQKRSNESIGNCPNCGSKVVKGKFGYYCYGNCGMNLAKVYGKELTEAQLRNLLSGKAVTYMHNNKLATVLPEVEPHSYNGKSGFQWKTK